ncbi:MAG: hypothetical protein IJU75_05035 [Clostridia bacterium]|nr:hypothetical protein [Clostridia bacterium]
MNFVIKKITSVFLSAVTLVAAASCGGDGSGDDTGTASVPGSGLVIATPAGSEYKIVRGENADSLEKSATATLKTAIFDVTGFNITAEDDWHRTTETVNDVRGEHEILVGRTNRPEYGAAKALLDEGKQTDVTRWVIAAIGEHIVLLGDTAFGTYCAARYFADNFTSGNNVFIPGGSLPAYGTYHEGDAPVDPSVYKNSTTFFRPPGNGATGDVIPIYHDGKYYVFFLYHTKGVWAYVTTVDFVNYSDIVVLNDFGGTGDVLYIDGEWHLFAAKVEDGKEVIHHYVGTELTNLRDVDRNIRPDVSRFVDYAWRDPRVWYDESIGKYRMLVCTDVRDGNASNRNGAVAWMTSSDLYNWETGGTFFCSSFYSGSNECPDYFKMGEWYYLVYSDCTFGKRTYYVKSKSPGGPWEIPDHDTFDSLFFYAAKTASDGRDRYIFGWAGDRSAEKFSMTTGTSYDADFATVKYAGEMVVHRLMQKENGDLVAVPVDSITGSFTRVSRNTMSVVEGDWKISSDMSSASVTDPGMATLVMQTTRNSFTLSFKLRCNAKEAGFGIHIPTSFTDKGYYFAIDRQYSRLRTRSGALTGVGGYYFPYESELEQPINFDPGKTYDITVICDGQIMVVYVGGECALTLRGISYGGLNLGLYCYAGTAEFSDIVLKTK